MVAVQKQTEIGGLDTDADELASREAGYLWREELWSAMRMFVAGYISANGMKGYDAVAKALDDRWGTDAIARPVSASVLRAALMNSERNNFRLEWAYWFAEQDSDIAALLGRHVRMTKTDREQLDDVIAELREELSHKRVEAVLRRARAR